MDNVNASVLEAIKKIVVSYDILTKTNYKKTEFDLIGMQWSTIKTTMHDLIRTIDADNDTSQRLLIHARRYLASYDFEREIDTLDGLYADDSERLRSIGLKMAESLEDKGLIVLFGDVCNV